MPEQQKDVFYYVTVMNENYVHPAIPEGVLEGIIRGMCRLPGRSASPLAGEGAPEHGAGAPHSGDATAEARDTRDTNPLAGPRAPGAGRGGDGVERRIQLLGSGTLLREVLAAADLLQQDWDVSADVWSVTSFTELRREGIDVDSWNRLHPDAEQKRTHVETCLAPTGGHIIAATDYMRTVGDLIRNWVPRP